MLFWEELVFNIENPENKFYLITLSAKNLMALKQKIVDLMCFLKNKVDIELRVYAIH